jgi:hypothetical protein
MIKSFRMQDLRLYEQGAPREREAYSKGYDEINVVFAPNTNAYILYIMERKSTLITTNQVQFDVHIFPFRIRKMVGQFYWTIQLIYYFDCLLMLNGFLTTLETTRRSIMTK